MSDKCNIRIVGEPGSGGYGGTTGGLGTEGRVIFQLTNGFTIGAQFKKIEQTSRGFKVVSFAICKTIAF